MTYLDVSKLEIVRGIYKNLDQYKQEFRNVLEREHSNNVSSIKFQSLTQGGIPVYFGKIETFMFKTDESLLDIYEKNRFNSQKRSILEKITTRVESSPMHKNFLEVNESVRQMFYNVMQPGAKINPHYGVNGIASKKKPDHFRIHITIDPGDNAYFCIENYYPLKYHENLCFGFEDGLVNHWAENLGTKMRIVLILDVDKIMLSEKISLIPL